MLETVDLTAELSKEERKERTAVQKAELVKLEQAVRKAKLPVIVLFEGWEAAGKGTLIGKTISCLDPRSFKVHSTCAPDAAESRMPMMWRFWRDLPAQGNISILDRSWYRETSVACVRKEIDGDEFERRLDVLNTFERQLSDDGYLIIKIFLHISRDEQRRRLGKLSDCNVTKWRVNDDDWEQNKHYDKYYRRFDRMMERTNTVYAPWNVISAEDRHLPETEIFSLLIRCITAALDDKRDTLIQGTPAEVPPASFLPVKMPLLKDVDLNKTLSDEEYKKLLKEEQKTLSKLHSKLYSRKLSVIIAYEGWDAGGKGGNIRRISEALDPRGYEAIPIAAPSREEITRHYLWRFWKAVPKTGHIAIFDRTWYGRVMVERIEGFTPEKRWKQAYREINEFEQALADEDILVIKFWIQIDKDEQLARFTERQNTPEKQWKITDEDWRNRSKWDDYETAIDEMLQKTSTVTAPWHIIEGNDKRYARIKALKIVNEQIREFLASKK